MKWYLKVLRQYADFGGRARRAEYWMFTLVSVIITVVLFIVDAAIDGTFAGPGILGLIYWLAVLLPSLAVGTRRLHDIGRSGWWQLLQLIPIIGAVVLIVFSATDGHRGTNAYGPDPKAAPAEEAAAVH